MIVCTDSISYCLQIRKRLEKQIEDYQELITHLTHKNENLEKEGLADSRLYSVLLMRNEEIFQLKDKVAQLSIENKILSEDKIFWMNKRAT